MLKPIRRLTRLCIFGLAAATTCAIAQPASYPERPIRLIVGVPPGGGADMIARLLADNLQGMVGQPVIVENRPGAAGNIAASEVARAKPDGYTLLLANSSHAVNSSLYKNLRFDPLKDFAPISQLTANYFFLTVKSDLPVKTLGELVQYAKSRKEPLSYASAGIGQGAHLGMAMFLSRAGIEGTHVPYAGMAPSAQALLGGHVDMVLLTPPAALPHATSGKIRMLAATSPKRVDSMPDLPTFAELGYQGFEVNNWQGLLAPTGTPPEIIEKLNRATAEALKKPAVVKQLETSGTDAVPSSPQDFGNFLKAETEKWAEVVVQSGAKVD
ncbi:tripartite tricarboxylate transporter substrate binding protein [Candidimonas sp. SYP-B2681]|uniref:Bug family tripartite tricarboxylate transporter substrate binding protein n=1 Tax=Candidimonas sp. SYP-B2681 TaxID=2497686 RepID=UPI001315A074|nr:tripartite tricarboxylate transporter substrate binding protein [Candidimonas sp. SYP-B2681]